VSLNYRTETIRILFLSDPMSTRDSTNRFP
jgi:hypothetical protein